MTFLVDYLLMLRITTDQPPQVSCHDRPGKTPMKDTVVEMAKASRAKVVTSGVSFPDSEWDLLSASSLVR